MSSNSTTGEAAGSSSSCCSTTTLFGAAALFALSFFLISVFICLRYLHPGRRRRDPIFVVQDEQGRRWMPTPRLGLDAAAIALLPSFPYLRTTHHGAETSVNSVECAVCLNAVDEGEMVRQLPGCAHVFHQECIDVWLSSNASCPVCRRKAEPAAAARGAEDVAAPRAAAATTSSVVVPVDMLDDEMVATAAAPPERLGTPTSGQETDLEAEATIAIVFRC
ncbi:hypothetical protein GUJ93_ZPchr0008g12452 [Zizania palustris]|uniref:RING-type E3 ubiquitin transferase n=1 Tax=Zizania palustris TaxID=103762 RepID=A0A8J5R4B6_ZIZPA|nr:hypothetical protein GUJ93_ZPchr0008g12452 [Zizania palustris]